MSGNRYFYQRAEAELRMARQAAGEAAAKAHYQLANLYLDRFYNPSAERAPR
jgi:hypothetical protein